MSLLQLLEDAYLKNLDSDGLVSLKRVSVESNGNVISTIPNLDELDNLTDSELIGIEDDNKKIDLDINKTQDGYEYVFPTKTQDDHTTMLCSKGSILCTAEGGVSPDKRLLIQLDVKSEITFIDINIVSKALLSPAAPMIFPSSIVSSGPNITENKYRETRTYGYYIKIGDNHTARNGLTLIREYSNEGTGFAPISECYVYYNKGIPSSFIISYFDSERDVAKIMRGSYDQYGFFKVISISTEQNNGYTEDYRYHFNKLWFIDKQLITITIPERERREHIGSDEDEDHVEEFREARDVICDIDVDNEGYLKSISSYENTHLTLIAKKYKFLGTETYHDLIDLQNLYDGVYKFDDQVKWLSFGVVDGLLWNMSTNPQYFSNDLEVTQEQYLKQRRDTLSVIKNSLLDIRGVFSILLLYIGTFEEATFLKDEIVFMKEDNYPVEGLEAYVKDVESIK